MYKIMLVEDEPALLKAMRDTLDWASLSFHPPVACTNGREAIENIEAGYLPDAVITDICMPFVDGVELTEYLARHCPQTLVVMLTGYDDFTYAHRGIKLKVYDYILKPITPKSLRLLAARLCEELENRRIKHTDEFDALARERFLLQLLTTRLDRKTIEDNFRVHRINPGTPYWTVLAADLSLPPAVTAVQNRDAELARYALGNILSELAGAYPCAVACVPVKDTYCVVLSGGEPEALMDTSRALALHADEACKLISQKVTCGVGRPVASPFELHECYLQAVLALHYRFFFGHVPCIFGAQIEVRPAAQFDYASHERAITAAVKQGSRQKTLEAVEALCAQMQAQTLPYELCLRTCQRTVLHLLELMGEYLSAEDVADLERAWDDTNFYAATTLQQLLDMLRCLCELAFDSFARVSEDDATLRVRRAEAYIREHYSDESLSLNTMRDVFSISVSYFSAIFKAGTGTTFVEYLTQVRLGRAKELLALTEKRAGEIAAEVGFADPHYFSVTFKRVTGLTPRDYRAQSRAGKDVKE